MPRTRSGQRSNAEEEQSTAMQVAGSVSEAQRSDSARHAEGRSTVDEGNGEMTSSGEGKKLSMAERMEKMKELRKKMADSSKANRKAVASESNRHKGAARINSTMARKMERGERALDERDAQERGEDYERTRSWTYTIEDNERWDEKLAQKEAKKDQGYIDPQSASERTYRRLVSQMKPDMKAYADQKAKATGQQPGPSSSSSSSALSVQRGPSSAVVKQDDLYAETNNLRYGTHKPDDVALDRVASYLNSEAEVRAKRSRHRPDDPDAEVTYINDKNKHYNKKIKRYYDQHTVTIRENFERGTAL